MVDFSQSQESNRGSKAKESTQPIQESQNLFAESSQNGESGPQKEPVLVFGAKKVLVRPLSATQFSIKRRLNTSKMAANITCITTFQRIYHIQRNALTVGQLLKLE